MASVEFNTKESSMKFVLWMLVLVVALAGGPAASATLFTWTGASSTAYDTAGNWSPSGVPDDANDSFRIDVATNTPVIYASTTYSISAGSINADTNDATCGLTINSGSLTTGSRVTIKGNQDGTNAATLTVAGGTFSPRYLEFIGGDGASDGHAIGDFDVDVTVVAITLSTTVTGNSDIDVATDKLLAAKELLVGDGTLPADLTIGYAAGGGEVDATALVIVVGDAADEDAIVSLDTGLLDVNGKVELIGAAGVNAQPKLLIASGTTFTPDTISLQGGDSSTRAAVIDLDVSTTVGASSGTEVTGFAQVNLATGVVFETKPFAVGVSNVSGDCSLISTASSTAVLRATKVEIKGGSSTVSKLTVTANQGKIETVND